MNKISSQSIEIYTYETEEEREDHVKFMEMHGWVDSGKRKQFTGKLLIDNTKNPDNYTWYAEFYRNNLG